MVANTAWNLWNYRSSLIRALQEHGFSVVLAAPEDRFRSRLEKDLRVRFVTLRHLSRSSLSVLSNIRCFLELAQLFGREKPDLILLFTIKPNLLGNWAARIAGVPVVSMVEGLGYGGSLPVFGRWLLAPVFRSAFKRTRYVVFLNKDDRAEYLQKKLIRKEQAFLLPGPGIDVRHFNVRPDFPREKAPLRFLFCGRLLVEKGIREFATAARKATASGLPARFYVLGLPDPGNPGSISHREWEQLQQEKSLRCLGSADDVRPFLAEADVLVLPSYYREGVPRSVLEGMAMGKIILTTDNPGCRDTVETGKNGFLIPARQADALFDAMVRTVNLPPGQRQAMGEHSRRLAVERFSDEQVIPPLMDLIKDLLAG